jgi:CHAT domain-containing protein/Tfp pilus assembly protein PilF
LKSVGICLYRIELEGQAMDSFMGKRRQKHRVYLTFIVAASLLQAAAYAGEILPVNQIRAKSSRAALQGKVRQLQVGRPIERELSGDQSHTYEIALHRKQYLDVVVEQRGIDVVVEVIAPGGKQLMKVDSPNGTQGDELVTLITETVGVYQIIVKSFEHDSPIGKYEIRLKALRAASEQDRALIEKNRVLQKAAELIQEVEQHYDAGEYDAALPLAERALLICENGLGKVHPAVAASLGELAKLYQAKGDVAKAEPLYLRALAIDEKALSKDDPAVGILLYSLAVLYTSTGDYAKAEPLFTRGLAIYEKTLGAEHPYTAMLLNNFAGLYQAKGDAAKAEPLYLRALAITEKNLGKDHPDIAGLLSRLASLYLTKGNYTQAEPLFTRALAIYDKTLGPEHPYTAIVLNNLVDLYGAINNDANAEPLYVRLLAIDEKNFDKDPLKVATDLHSLAYRYEKKGDYAKAETMCLRALAIREQVLGKDHPDVATSLSALAVLYEANGEYTKAEPMLVRALAIDEKVYGKNHPEIASDMGNLANLYQEKGDYAQAELLYVRALATYEGVSDTDTRHVPPLLNNLAFLYIKKGDYVKAEPLYLRALAILEKSLGKDHPDTAFPVKGLAGLYYAKGDYAQAEPLFIRALAIRERALGPEHPQVAISLSDLAALYNSKGDSEKAEPLYIRSLAIAEKAFGKDHPYTATGLNNLANLYRERGNYAQAETLYLRALAICEKTLDTTHYDTAITLNSLALLYNAEGDYARAADFQSRCNDIIDRNLINNLASGSERQKLTYLNQTSSYLDLTISLHVQSTPNDLNAQRAALKVLLQRKGRVLDAMTDTFAILRRHLLPEDRELLSHFLAIRSQLSVLALRGPRQEGLEKHQANLKAIAEQEEKLQNDISRRSVAFRVQLQTQSKPVTIEEVQKALPPGAALVEFAQYHPIVPKKSDADKNPGKPRYVVFVLPSQGESLWADLGDAESINQMVDAFRRALRDKYRHDVKRLARMVDQKVMQPVRNLLGQTHRVFIAPDSALNLIPFAALVDEAGDYLVNKYHFTYLTSGRDLLRLRDKVESKAAPVVMADADFDKAATGMNASQGQQAANHTSQGDDANNDIDKTTGPRIGGIEFEPLKRLTASAEEARDVKAALPQATVYLRGAATETILKQVASPSILHIATHGFFLEEEVKPGEKISESTRIATRKKKEELRPNVRLESPALRSGLFFAGANRGKSGEDDGVLTALEAAGLDLWGTKLVVLSACDTGVGEVVNGEGVQGLRRALVLAGSESQIMSLWPVSDRGTRDLMIDYYKRLQAGQGRSEALRQAQLKMLKNPQRQHPYYWASFIQSGEWANLDGKR